MSYSLSDVCDLQKTAESTIDDWYRYLSGRSLNKVEYFSSVLCGSVYELSALGEGVHGLYDQFPLYRLDAFDCQTFVETVLALAWADSFSLFLKNKCFISYRGRDVDFFNRTHFICLDWRHLFRGLLSLVDITADCVRKFPMLNLRVSSVDIDRSSWFQSKTIKAIRLLDGSLPTNVEDKLQALYHRARGIEVEVSALAYIACKDLFSISNDQRRILLSAIPSGSVMLIIRAEDTSCDKSLTAMHVKHLGFVIHKANEVLFRHASREKGYVTDQLCDNYLRDFMVHTPSVGIMIYQVS